MTRKKIPEGYGVREQCLPFTAAAALGFQIRSPISFGVCRPEDVPADAHAFRSPLDAPEPDGEFDDPRVYYVWDDPNIGFFGNAFELTAVLGPGFNGTQDPLVEPGLSFFERKDQLDLFKLHLPYIWRTPSEVNALFLPRINSSGNGLFVMSGLVETDWYANPVNLVLAKPDGQQAVHISAGDAIAQVIFMQRSHRHTRLVVVEADAPAAATYRDGLAHWHSQHGTDRSAYKRLARSAHGRINQSACISPSSSTSSTSSS